MAPAGYSFAPRYDFSTGKIETQHAECDSVKVSFPKLKEQEED